MKISIIVPIYNVENYIEKCIKSVLRQTYRNFELLLVNDGSPDNSKMICEKYQMIDSRVKLLNKKNGGLSDARNYGIQNATGEYLMFLDGDDFWGDKSALEKLVNRITITNVDVLNFSYVKYYEEEKKKVPYFYNIPNMPLNHEEKEQQVNYIMKNSLYIASACNKLLKKELFESGELYFEKGIFSEDIEWCMRVLMKAESFDFVCENFYYYRQREGSITHSIKQQNCVDLKNSIIKCINLVEDNKFDKMLNYYIAYQYATFFIIQAQAEVRQTELIDELCEYKWILKYYGNNRKVRILYYLCKMMGYKCLCSMIRKVYQLKRVK